LHLSLSILGTTIRDRFTRKVVQSVRVAEARGVPIAVHVGRYGPDLAHAALLQRPNEEDRAGGDELTRQDKAEENESDGADGDGQKRPDETEEGGADEADEADGVDGVDGAGQTIFLNTNGERAEETNGTRGVEQLGLRQTRELDVHVHEEYGDHFVSSSMKADGQLLGLVLGLLRVKD
jgi:hypothetical protein